MPKGRPNPVVGASILTQRKQKSRPCALPQTTEKNNPGPLGTWFHSIGQLGELPAVGLRPCGHPKNEAIKPWLTLKGSKTLILAVKCLHFPPNHNKQKCKACFPTTTMFCLGVPKKNDRPHHGRKESHKTTTTTTMDHAPIARPHPRLGRQPRQALRAALPDPQRVPRLGRGVEGRRRGGREPKRPEGGGLAHGRPGLAPLTHGFAQFLSEKGALNPWSHWV